MNILEQYRKAVKARDDRLGSGWAVTLFEEEFGAVFEYWSGVSHEFLVGDRLTLCHPRWARECIYGEAKVIKRIDADKVIMQRVS